MSRAARDIFIDFHTAKGENTFIVPGGTTPRLFFQYLAGQAIDWSHTTLIPSDERLLEGDASDSNTGMIKANLLDLIPGNTGPRLIPVVNGFSPGETGRILRFLNSATRSLLPPKAAFLGIGPDGHTASLFPGFEEESSTDDPFILVKRSSESFQRVSVCAQALREIPFLVFLASGVSKKPVIKRLVNSSGSLDLLPVERIVNDSIGRVTILCDREAAPQ